MAKNDIIKKHIEYEEILYRYGRVLSGLVPRMIILYIDEKDEGSVQFSELYELIDIVGDTPGALSHHLRELILLGFLEKPPRTRGIYRITEEGRKAATFLREVIKIVEKI